MKRSVANAPAFAAPLAPVAVVAAADGQTRRPRPGKDFEKTGFPQYPAKHGSLGSATTGILNDTS
jgi:hypothetical protein